MTAIVVSLIGIVLVALGYQLNRRINQAVSWSASQSRGSFGVTLTVTNTGTSRARGVTVELDPQPSIEDGPSGPVEVDRGAVVLVTYTPIFGSTPPSRVTVHWGRRLRRDGVWTTPI